MSDFDINDFLTHMQASGLVAMVDRGDCCIRFSDLSRNINGAVPLGMWAQTEKYAIETLVMTNYDFGNYSSSSTTLEWKE